MRIRTRAAAVGATLSGVAISIALVGLPAAPAVAAGPYVPYGAIGAEWQAKGGASGFLGAPTSFEYDVPGVPGARIEEFVGGQILWSPATGAHEVHGAILVEYVTESPGGAANYGLPLTDETTTPDGIGRFNHFQGGSIYWTPATGAHAVYGAIRDNWSAGGWERGPLGYPTQDEINAPRTNGAREQDFTGGQEYWTPALGAHEVHGAILAEYVNLGDTGSFLGFPLTNETTTPDGIGRYNHFQGGSIYWTPATGAHAVDGAIRDNWAAGGWERGPLGYPTTNEFDLSLPSTPGARLQNFASGQEYWSPNLGAHEVHGAILTEYRGLGGPGSFLGLPLTNETTTPDGVGRFNHFQGGSIYWTPATGAHEVHQQIEAAWAGTGWELGPLGYPVTDQVDATGGRPGSIFRNFFQHGFIELTNGVATVHVV